MTRGLLTGFIFALSLVASVFFLKFWRQTRDRLFLAFAIAFALEGLSRLITAFAAQSNEAAPEIYLLRLIGYLIILVAILHKNRARR